MKILNPEINEYASIIKTEKLRSNRNILFFKKITIPKKYGSEKLSDDFKFWLNQDISIIY